MRKGHDVSRRGVDAIQGTLHPGGRFTLVGHGHYTGGTLYRHRREKYSFAGTAPPCSAIVARGSFAPCAVPPIAREAVNTAPMTAPLSPSHLTTAGMRNSGKLP